MDDRCHHQYDIWAWLNMENIFRHFFNAVFDRTLLSIQQTHVDALSFMFQRAKGTSSLTFTRHRKMKPLCLCCMALHAEPRAGSVPRWAQETRWESSARMVESRLDFPSLITYWPLEIWSIWKCPAVCLVIPAALWVAMPGVILGVSAFVDSVLSPISLLRSGPIFSIGELTFFAGCPHIS